MSGTGEALRRCLAVLLAGALVYAAGVGDSVSTPDSPRALDIRLSAAPAGADGFPTGLRVRFTNRSTHRITGGNLRLSIIVGDEVYVWLRSPVKSLGEFRLNPGASVVRMLPAESLVFYGHHDVLMNRSGVMSKLTNVCWSLVAWAADETGHDPSAYPTETIQSNALLFGRCPATHAKP